jgi:uncharacterized protein YcaQ
MAVRTVPSARSGAAAEAGEAAAVDAVPMPPGPARRERLTLAQARRVALAAQGFGVTRPSGAVTMRQIQRVMDTIGVVQIDSVNVFSRSHYMPFFSRLGPYPRSLLDRASSTAPRRMVEYWAHEASFVAPETHRLLRFRMARAAEEAWGGMARAVQQQPGLRDDVREVIAAHGPLTAAAVERRLGHERTRDRTNWGWNWSDVKRVVEFLFWSGEISSAGRTTQFERRYALPGKVLPAAVASAPDPDPDEARRGLIRIAARAHGVAIERDLRDYFRLRPLEAREAIAGLVEDGELLPVTVDGWDRPAYLHPEARVPRRVNARALVSPFDSVVWERARTEALFGFRYRLEIYTPAAARVHGYYVLPFLLDERLVARVDLKSERVAAGQDGGALRVKAAWLEPGNDAARVAAELAAELRVTAEWLELDDVVVDPAGDLAAHLDAALRAD